MKHRLLILVMSTLAIAGCGSGTAPEQQLTPEQQLKASFVKEIADSGIVRDFKQNGDEVLFSAKHGEQEDAKWRVHVDAASIERKPDGTTPYKGLVKSSWYVNGEQIVPRGAQADLPLAFLDRGIAQECWAFWDDSTHHWSWK